jgi:hypothetical protein
VIPYLARKSISFPEGFEDIGKARLDEMEGQDVVEGEEELQDIPFWENFKEDDNNEENF